MSQTLVFGPSLSGVTVFCNPGDEVLFVRLEWPDRTETVYSVSRSAYVQGRKAEYVVRSPNRTEPWHDFVRDVELGLDAAEFTVRERDGFWKAATSGFGKWLEQSGL